MAESSNFEAAVRKIVFPGKPGRLSEPNKAALMECCGVMQCMVKLVGANEEKDQQIRSLQSRNTVIEQQLLDIKADVEELEAEVDELEAQKEVDETELFNRREEYTANNSALAVTTEKLTEALRELALFKPEAAFPDTMTDVEINQVLQRLLALISVYQQELLQRAQGPPPPVPTLRVEACTVCLDNSNKVFSTLPCGHIYCSGCANKMFTDNCPYPNCRATITQAPVRLYCVAPINALPADMEL